MVFRGGLTAGFSLFYLLQNPNLTTDAHVSVTYLRAQGRPKVYDCVVPKNSRQNIWLNQESCPSGAEPADGELQGRDVSAIFEVTNNVPIIAERAMYLGDFGSNPPIPAGHESAGVTATSTNWFLAEGSTGANGFFNTFVLLANPNLGSVTVRVQFLRQGTTPVYWVGGDATTDDPNDVRTNVTLDPESRTTLYLNVMKGLDNQGGISAVITVTSGGGILAERAMWWPYGFSTWAEAHNGFGTTQTGTLWALAEGEASAAPRSDETYILIANTSNTDAVVKVTLLSDEKAPFDFAPERSVDYVVPANGRTTVGVNYDFTPIGEPSIVGKRFGALVESLTGEQIVVERAMYSSDGGPATFGPYWPAGTNALATRLR